jgi:hypothetical protein
VGWPGGVGDARGRAGSPDVDPSRHRLTRGGGSSSSSGSTRTPEKTEKGGDHDRHDSKRGGSQLTDLRRGTPRAS